MIIIAFFMILQNLAFVGKYLLELQDGGFLKVRATRTSWVCLNCRQ